MKIPERLTTENTGYYAGTWHRVDGVDRYFTREYIAYCERRDARTRRIQHGAVRVEQSTAFNQWQGDPAAKFAHLGPRTCSECGTEFTPHGPKQMTCGNPECKRQRHLAKNRAAARAAYHRRKKVA